jgi:hypothetical protein
MTIKIEIQPGQTIRLKTAGKYCDRDIVITAKSAGGDTSAKLGTAKLGTMVLGKDGSATLGTAKLGTYKLGG